MRIKRWDCNATGPYIGKTYCRVRSLSRSIQAVTWEFQLLKKVTKLDANFQFYRRNIVGNLNWRFLFKLDKIDACAVLRGAKTLPIAESFYKMYANEFASLPQSCPMKPGNFSARNVQISFGEKDDPNKTAKENQEKSFGIFEGTMSKMTTALFPNGIYKNVLQFSVENSPQMTLSFTTEVDYRMSEDNFK
jgi:hypothetical protein